MENKSPLSSEWASLFLDLQTNPTPERRKKTGRFCMNVDNENKNQPFFMDVTLRDGNQALRKPWNPEEKKQVFDRIVSLGIQGVEVGFASASSLDFESCKELSKLAPSEMVISSLSRASEREIEGSWEALKASSHPRLHIVYPISKFARMNVLKLSEAEVIQKVKSTVQFARQLAGNKASIQFSGEHFGDCLDSMEFARLVYETAIDAGADVINLPNTVERYRPALFIHQVSEIASALGHKAIVSVHTHNDLGMATATTVESYFAGATQLETALNGLGERAGNTNFYEVVCALENCEVKTGINRNRFHEVAEFIALASNIPIPEKAPVVGDDVFSHRSGIHQDGVWKTKEGDKGLYSAFRANVVGRKEGDRIRFTSQSGTAGVQAILGDLGVEITKDQALKLQPYLKSLSEKEQAGELEKENILLAYEKLFLQPVDC